MIARAEFENAIESLPDQAGKPRNVGTIIRARALTLLAELVERELSVSSELIETVSACGIRVRISIEPAPEPPVGPQSFTPINPLELKPSLAGIVALLSRDKPAKAEWLAMKLGKQSGGSFRTLCADLVRLGIARHVKAVGYFLAR